MDFWVRKEQEAEPRREMESINILLGWVSNSPLVSSAESWKRSDPKKNVEKKKKTESEIVVTTNQ